MAKTTPETKSWKAKKPTNNRLSEKEIELARMLITPETAETVTARKP